MRQDVVAEARGWIGTPYQHQASLKQVGCDCLGLVTGIWRALYGPLPEIVPPYAADWAEAGQKEVLAEAAMRHLVPAQDDLIRPGDVLLFRWRMYVPAKHLAIATDPGFMVHAHDGAVVTEVPLGPFWRRKIAYRFSFPEIC